MIFDIAKNMVYCSKCEGLCISKANKMFLEMGSDANEFIESDDYEMYVCRKCGYSDYIDEDR